MQRGVCSTAALLTQYHGSIILCITCGDTAAVLQQSSTTFLMETSYCKSLNNEIHPPGVSRN
jgi:hypothetical protein